MNWDNLSEGALRSRANAIGWRISKSRDRTEHANNKGLFQLANDRNYCVAGADFDADLEVIAHHLRCEYEQLGR